MIEYDLDPTNPDTFRVLDDLAAARTHITELEAENAAFREHLDAAALDGLSADRLLSMLQAEARIAELEAENARLRSEVARRCRRRLAEALEALDRIGWHGLTAQEARDVARTAVAADAAQEEST